MRQAQLSGPVFWLQQPSALGNREQTTGLRSSTQVLHGVCPSRHDWTAFLHAACVGAWHLDASLPYALVAGVYTDVPDDRWWLHRLMHQTQVQVLPICKPGCH